MDLIYRFNKNQTYLISKNVYDISFISGIYSDLSNSSYFTKEEDLNNKPVNISYELNYRREFYIDSDDNINNIDKIIKHFNIVIRNSLIQKNSSILKTKFAITLNKIKLNITEPFADTSAIFKRNSLSIIIPISELSLNEGTISTFNTFDSQNNNIDLSLNRYVDEEKHITNYGKIENYDVDTKRLLIQNENLFEFYPGDVIIINNGVYSRMLPNTTNKTTAYLELEYDISL